MIYVMSDLHGEYDKFMAMLEKINFSEEDSLFLLGDLVDRGPQPIRLLQSLMTMPNVYPLYGNHDVMAYEVLKKLTVEITEENYAAHLDEDTMMALLHWRNNGGDVTMAQFQKLSLAQREEILDYFASFAWYETLDVGEKTYLLVHAGLGNFRPDKKLGEYTPAELAFLRPDYERQYFADEYIEIVCGHTPTKLLCGAWRIYRSHHNICIDCGACYGGKLACLCLDSGEEFYVD